MVHNLRLDAKLGFRESESCRTSIGALAPPILGPLVNSEFLTTVQFGCLVDEDDANICPTTVSLTSNTTQAKPYKIESFGSIPTVPLEMVTSSTTSSIPAPSAFATARRLGPFDSVDYPEGVHGPVMDFRFGVTCARGNLR